MKTKPPSKHNYATNKQTNKAFAAAKLDMTAIHREMSHHEPWSISYYEAMQIVKKQKNSYEKSDFR